MKKTGFSEKSFDIFNMVFMLSVVFLTLYPAYYLLCASFSDSNSLLVHRGLLFYPIDFTLGAYKLTFSYPLVGSGYKNTLMVLLGALPINLLLTIFCAYILAAKNMRAKKIHCAVCHVHHVFQRRYDSRVPERARAEPL